MTTVWTDGAQLVQAADIAWSVRNDAGRADIRMSFDFRLNPTGNASLRQFATSIWFDVWAPLLARSTECVSVAFFAINLAGPTYLFADDRMRGAVFGSVADVNDSAVIVQWLGGFEPESNHRVYLPFMASQFVERKQLTTTALSRLQTSLRGLALGTNGDGANVGPKQIVFQRPRLGNRWRPERPARYALVEQNIACSYTDRPPFVVV